MSKQNSYNQSLGNNKNAGSLVIYKASAGSGKTHTITEQFLLLILNPCKKDNYKNILAVTFTKKATEEMKSRIVFELAKLANGGSSNYADKICSTYKLNREELKQNAKSLLERILHDYSSFSISTIDSFFQKILRTFAHDLGMVDDFEIELDSNFVISRGVDLMLDNLDERSNDQLLKWLVKFSLDNLEEGKKWDRKEEIELLSRELNKEVFKENRKIILESIKDKTILERYSENLNKIVKSFLTEISSKAINFSNLLHENKLEFCNLKGNSRTPFNYINKLANRDFKDISKSIEAIKNIDIEDIDNWLKKTDRKNTDLVDRVNEVYNSGGKKIIKDLLNYYDEEKEDYFTAKIISQNIYAIGILGDVALNMEEFIRENEIVLISDTTEIINKINQNIDTPFLYERVGEFYNHFMIDEFQDTSGMQWQNFKPLLVNSLASGNTNFVVGDIKQSIYRWRNSDWRLLDSKISEDLKGFSINIENLEMNWRSVTQIIEFNNFLFPIASRILQREFDTLAGVEKDNSDNKIIKLYQDVRQKIPDINSNKQGLVKFQFIEKDTKDVIFEIKMELLINELKKLQDNGVKLNDIAILVRNNTEATEIANKLLIYKSENKEPKYKFDIISNESLFVGTAPIIKLIISLLDYLTNTSNELLRLFAGCELIKHKLKFQKDDKINTENIEQLALDTYLNDYEFPDGFMEKLSEVQKLPLYELIESILEMFEIDFETNDQIYIQTFMDIVLEYTEKYGGDLYLFLKWWKDSGFMKKLPLPESQEAIQIMTIHKSKGLGFEVVIIPSCEWELNKYSNMIWVSPKENKEKFNTLPLFPIKYSKDLLETIFVDYHNEEFLKNYIDNLNLLYVAFTRAKKGLICFAQEPSDKEKNKVSFLIKEAIKLESREIENEKDFKHYFNEEQKYFQYGEYEHLKSCHASNSTQEITGNIFMSIPINDRLKLKTKNIGLSSETGQREYGIVMHDILGRINRIEDLEKTLDSYIERGIIDKDEKLLISGKLSTFMKKQLVKNWFNGTFTNLNERDILIPGGKLYRPDRVMISDSEIIVIDYKFGEIENKAYYKQIENYLSIIRRMNCKDVKGYLCYVTLDKIIEIF